MKKVTLPSLGLIAFLVAANAFATEQTPPSPQGDTSPGGKIFAESDGNNDGFISKDEWRIKGDKMFSDIDSNGDGKLTQDETKAHREKKRAEWKDRRAGRQEKMGEMKEKLRERKELRGAPATEPAKQ